MSEKERGFLGQIRGSLISPRGAFESVDGKDLWKGVVLIIILTAVSAWAGYIYASKLPVTIPDGFGSLGRARPFGRAGSPMQFTDPEVFRRNTMTLYALRDGLGVFTGWLITAVLLHLFASLMAGRGSLKRTLALTGFSSIPLLFQQLLRLIDAYTISGEAFLGIMGNRILGKTLTLHLMSEALNVFTVFGIWTLALTIVAVSINYTASTKKAAAAVISSYVLLIILRLFLPI